MSTKRPRLVYLIGAPGAGKTTLMRRLTEDYARVAIPKPDTKPAPPYVPADALVHDGVVFGYEMGRRRGEFSGTDALGMSVITQAEPWLRAVAPSMPLVLAEGARLANRRFLSSALAYGYEVTVCHVDHEYVGVWRAERAHRLGKEQDRSWVNGRDTAARNLFQWATETAAVQSLMTAFRGDPDAVAEFLRWEMP